MLRTFQGTSSQYRTLHKWVESKMGKPMWCWKCWDRSRTRYHWANRSGEYLKNIFDWDRLCPSCHFQQDSKNLGTLGGKKDFCKRGHKMESNNIMYRGNMNRNPNVRYRACRACNHAVRKERRLALGDVNLRAGQHNGMAKLTVEQVAEIRKLLEKGMWQYKIAEKFNVGKTTVGRISRRESWK